MTRMKIKVACAFIILFGGRGGAYNEGGITGGSVTDSHVMVVMLRQYPMWSLGYARV